MTTMTMLAPRARKPYHTEGVSSYVSGMMVCFSAGKAVFDSFGQDWAMQKNASQEWPWTQASRLFMLCQLSKFSLGYLCYTFIA